MLDDDLSLSAASSSTGPAPYGLVVVGSTTVGLPLSLLREVVPAPARYLDLPESGDCMLGAVDVRGTVVPVVELGAHATDGASVAGDTPGSGPVPGSGRLVAVLERSGELLGLVADRVLGVEFVAPERLQLLHRHDGQVPTFPSCYLDGDRVVSVLHGGALFSRPDVQTVPAPASRLGVVAASDGVTDITQGAACRQATAGETGSAAMLLVQVADVLVAIDALAVHTVLPDLVLRPSVLESAVCWGTTTVEDRQVPVADLLAVLGLGALHADGTRQGIALRHPRGLVGLALSAVHEIRAMSVDEVRPLPAVGLARPELFRGTWSDPSGRIHLVVDVDRLLAEADVVSMAALNTGSAPTDAAADTIEDEAGRQRAGRRYMACSAGVDVALAIDTVDELVRAPEAMLTTTGRSGPDALGVLGTFVHRGRAIPLVDLAHVLGTTARSGGAPDRHVVVCHDGETIVGFLVDRLIAIATSTWEEDDRFGQHAHRTASVTLGNAPLIRLDITEVEGLLPRLDLRALLRAYRPASSIVATDDAVTADLAA